MDGRRTLTHDKSSHGLWPGELKTKIRKWLVPYLVVNSCDILIFFSRTHQIWNVFIIWKFRGAVAVKWYFFINYQKLSSIELSRIYVYIHVHWLIKIKLKPEEQTGGLNLMRTYVCNSYACVAGCMHNIVSVFCIIFVSISG